ncbi:hypothetical protein Leryth_019592 [Lithospermum erythrorhizon]|nr:hypothetical protein Leryth_019592 [Lithospermum erythrorhizon]
MHVEGVNVDVGMLQTHTYVVEYPCMRRGKKGLLFVLSFLQEYLLHTSIPFVVLKMIKLRCYLDNPLPPLSLAVYSGVAVAVVVTLGT